MSIKFHNGSFTRENRENLSLTKIYTNTVHLFTHNYVKERAVFYSPKLLLQLLKLVIQHMQTCLGRAPKMYKEAYRSVLFNLVETVYARYIYPSIVLVELNPPTFC